MKKIILIPFIFLAMILFTSAKSVPYAIKCYKCYECKIPYSNIRIRTLAHRSFKDEYKNNGYEGYCIYRCNNGHYLYVNYDTGERK